MLAVLSNVRSPLVNLRIPGMSAVVSRNAATVLATRYLNTAQTTLHPVNPRQMRLCSSNYQPRISSMAKMKLGLQNAPFKTTCANRGFLGWRGIVTPSYLSPAVILEVIEEMVQNKEIAALQNLIVLLDNEKNFYNISRGHLIGLKIRQALYQKRDLTMITTLFPFFKKEREWYGNQYTEYYDPIEKGDLELVKAIHKGGIPLSPYNYPTPINGEVLLYAIAHQQKEIVRYLLEHGGYDINKAYLCPIRILGNKIDLKSPNGTHIGWDEMTPMRLAKSIKDNEMATLLVELGAKA